MTVKYVHINLVARDWRSLADFYKVVFDCVPVPPERHLSGRWVDELTGMKDCVIRGIHLALPGADGITLEIFSYEPAGMVEEKRLNNPGFGHIAFQVDDVEVALKRLEAHGGSRHGAVVKKDYEGIGTLSAVYAVDPEGNFLELQNWTRAS